MLGLRVPDSLLLPLQIHSPPFSTLLSDLPSRRLNCMHHNGLPCPWLLAADQSRGGEGGQSIDSLHSQRLTLS